jgi:hypothetical protein
MNRAFARTLKIALAVAARSTRGKLSAPAVVQKLEDTDPALYGEWRRVTPQAEARLVFVRRALNPGGSTSGLRKPAVAPMLVWPIGSRQRWDIEVALGHFSGPAPVDLAPKFYLHNYGERDAFDVMFEFGGGYVDYTPLIAGRESVEVEWPSDSLPSYDAESGVTPGEVEARITFSDRGKVQTVEGLLAVEPGGLPTWFQLTGPSDAPDHVRDIR